MKLNRYSAAGPKKIIFKILYSPKFITRKLVIILIKYLCNTPNFLTMQVRNNWTLNEIQEIYYRPLLDLIYDAATVHRQNKAYGEVQISSLAALHDSA